MSVRIQDMIEFNTVNYPYTANIFTCKNALELLELADNIIL